MLDQEKLITELKNRIKRSKNLHDLYKKDNAVVTANELSGKIAAYQEILYDINKNKFKLKEK